MTSARPGRLSGSRFLCFARGHAVPLLLVVCAGSFLFASPNKQEGEATPGGWPEITAVERAQGAPVQDPEAVAVLLRNDRQGKILKVADDTVNILKYHWRLKVLREAGKEFAAIHIPADKNSRVSNIQARTIRPDGSVVPVADDQIFQKVVRQVGSYKFMEWVFNFPAVEPGAILEYQFERRSDGLVAIAPWYFEGPVFTLRSRVTQSVLWGMGYSILCDLCQGVKPEVSPFHEGKIKGETYAVELKNLPGYRREIFMPPPREISPRLEMVLQTWNDHLLFQLGRQDRFFTDWPSVAKYSAANYEYAAKDGLQDLKPLVSAWTEGAVDSKEKMKAVFRHVQRDYAYIPFDDVYGSGRSLQNILKSAYADNEEKAVLLQAALKLAGIDSDIAMVSGKYAGSLNPKFVSFTQFDHDVVVVPQASGPQIVLDPTVSYAPFGFMPWQDSGAGALFLKAGQGELGLLPVENELSTTKYRVTVRPRADGKADLEIEARYTGEDAIAIRDDLIPYSETARADALADWLQAALPGASLISQSLENLDDTEEPLVVKVKAEASGLVNLAEGAATAHGCVLFCRDVNPFTRAQRQHPLYVDRGWNVEQVVTILPPEGMKALEPHLGVTARSAIGNFTMRCSMGDSNEVRCSRYFVAPLGRWSASDMDGVRAMYDKIVEADHSSVAFQSAAPSGN